MLKLSHTALVGFSGFIWLAIGCYLLPLGLNLILNGGAELHAGSLPLLSATAAAAGSVEEAAIFLIALGLAIGYFKGKYVLGKSAKRGIERIRSFPNPTSLSNIYSAKYYILLGSMVALGMSVKLFGLPNDIRGVVDVTIGSALINGAIIYFRNAVALRKSTA